MRGAEYHGGSTKGYGGAQGGHRRNVEDADRGIRGHKGDNGEKLKFEADFKVLQFWA